MSKMEETRIYNEHIHIDTGKVQEFWHKRAHKELPYSYNLVTFQDDNPDVAIKRDKIEKDKIKKLIDIKESDTVLDIGCGIGRWCDELSGIIGSGRYVGVDYTEEFVNIARERYKDSKRCVFLNGDFRKIEEALEEAGELQRFDKIFINGVLMYINDEDVPMCLGSLNKLVSPNGTIYIKESVGIKGRLTLNDFYSSELGAYYFVIYRRIDQYEKLFVKYIENAALYACGPTFTDTIDYNAETSNWYWVLKHMEQQD